MITRLTTPKEDKPHFGQGNIRILNLFRISNFVLRI